MRRAVGRRCGTGFAPTLLADILINASRSTRNGRSPGPSDALPLRAVTWSDAATVQTGRVDLVVRELGNGAGLFPLEVWHAEEFAAHLDRAREHIRPWVGPAFVTDTVEGARGTLRRYADKAAADGARLFGIRLDGQLVGGVMFVDFSAASGVCEVGCWLEPGAEGRGLITAGCRALLDWAFDTRGLHRAEWRCRDDNVRSAAVAERLGMTLEGVLRGAWLNGGVHHDKQVWAVLASEWQPAGGRPLE